MATVFAHSSLVHPSIHPFIYPLFSNTSLEYRKNLGWIMLMDKNQWAYNRATNLGEVHGWLNFRLELLPKKQLRLRLWSWTWVWIPTLPLILCATLGFAQLSFFLSFFIINKTGGGSPFLLRLFWELNTAKLVRAWVQCLTIRKGLINVS